MKKITFVLGLLLTFQAKSQNIIKRVDLEAGVGIYTSLEKVQSEKNLYLGGSTYIPTDTNQSCTFFLKLLYNVPEAFYKDSTDYVRFVFSNGEFLDFYRDPRNLYEVSKDSVDGFLIIVDFPFLEKIDKLKINTVRISTSGFEEVFEMGEADQLDISRVLHNYLMLSVEEYNSQISFQNAFKPNDLIFDSSPNKTLNKKWYGKYQGEWSAGKEHAEIELNITPDTSYLLWKNSRFEKDDTAFSMIIPQTLMITDTTIENQIICTVCFDEKYPNRTNGTRTFTLIMSEDGKIIYGNSNIESYSEGFLFLKKTKKQR